MTTTSTASGILQCIRDGVTVYDLSHPMEYGMPRAPVHPEFRMNLVRRHGDTHRPDGTSAASEIVITGGHVGTHIDALAHFSLHGELFGGVSAEEAQRGGRFATRGIDEFAPTLCRGVLLDVASVLGADVLPGGYGIGVDDLERAAEVAGVEIQEGDIVFVRTGWSANFGDVTAFRGWATGVPGLTEEGARWLADRRVLAAGADTINFEQIHPEQGSRVLPVHRLLLVERGINIIEICNLEQVAHRQVHEFGVVAAPLNLVGATGAPARLLGIVDGAR